MHWTKRGQIGVHTLKLMNAWQAAFHLFTSTELKRKLSIRSNHCWLFFCSSSDTELLLSLWCWYAGRWQIYNKQISAIDYKKLHLKKDMLVFALQASRCFHEHCHVKRIQARDWWYMAWHDGQWLAWIISYLVWVKLTKLRRCVSGINWNVKAVGHSFQRIYDIPWTTSTQ